MAQERLTGLFAERYLIEQELGHGASSVVYLAHDKKHDRQIALKVLSKDLAHALGPERFLQEIHLTARLHHPHVLPIFDSGEWNGLLYYVLPFVRGESLREKIDREKQLPIEECVRITCEVADALAHAHAEGVIHRDVKPENVMLSDGHALLADFGIARALDVHTGERLTSSGLIVGTSAYMSPEQASGEEKIDARSDIYSLACVLYEMIAGVQAFTGPTTQSVIAQRFKHSPRPVSTFRPAVPEYLEHVLEKALAISPADRFQNVKDFAAELPDVPGVGGDKRRSRLRRTVYGRRKLFGFAAAALAAITAAFVAANPPGDWRSLFFAHPALDSTKYIVVPSPSSGGRISAADVNAANEVQRTLQKWTGLSVVDPQLVRDALAEKPFIRSRDEFELAKKYGAGRLIRVSSALDATAYDVRTGNTLREFSGADAKGARDANSMLALTLLATPDRPKAAAGGDGHTSSFPAWLAYGRGHAALQKGDFGTALSEFIKATRYDQDFIPAVVWRTQLMEWMVSENRGSWTDGASRVASRVSGLAGRDSLVATAVGAMAERRYTDACRAYAALTRSNPDDFVGWFGSGECREKDSAVISNPRSPSGFSFRSSFREAVAGFARAILTAPEVYELLPFRRMQGMLPTSLLKFRGGWSLPPKRAAFAAYPTLDHDTLAFVPFLASRFGLLAPGLSTTRPEALKRNRQHLLAFAVDWTRHSPQSADAFEALASVVEVTGEIGTTRSSNGSAMDAVRKAQRLSTNRAQMLRLRAAEVRLRFKQSDFSGARRLADSLLAGARIDSLDEPLRLAVLAGLIGRASEMAHWAHEAKVPSSFTGVNVPPGMSKTAADFFAYAALGICAPVTENLEAELERELRSYATESERADVRAATETRALSMLSPCSGGSSSLRIERPNGRLFQAQQAYAKRDFRKARAILDTTAALRKDFLPGEVSFDYTYQEAWLKAAMGDTAGAISSLDLALDALPALSASTLDEPAAAAAVGRAMALRSDLATKGGDRRTALMWARALAELWASADEDLQPTVARMRLAVKQK